MYTARPLREALLIATLTGLATGLGVVPFFFRESIPRRAYDTVLGAGAGLMLSAATLGLLAAALERVRPAGVLDGGALAQVLAGFGAGVLVLALMEKLPHQHAAGHGHHHEHVRKGLLISGAMTIHRLPEGFAIGAGFAAGDERMHSLGWVLAVAIAFQNVCEGAVMAAPLRHAGWSRLRTLAAVTATGLAVPLAAIFGYLAGEKLAAALPFSLSLAAGALIYLVSNEIIPETHSHGHERAATAGLALGFAVTIVVASLGHTH
jgi:ZIP family zinc transporter